MLSGPIGPLAPRGILDNCRIFTRSMRKKRGENGKGGLNQGPCAT